MKIIGNHTLSAVLEDGTVVLAANSGDGQNWTIVMDEDVSMDLKSARGTLEFIGNLVEEHVKLVQRPCPDFTNILETPKDVAKATVGSRWISETGIEYERREDSWYCRVNGRWQGIAPPLRYLEPEV